MKNFLPMLTLAVAAAVVFAGFPAFAAAADSRREAARLAAQKAEEATNRRRTGMAATSVSGQSGAGASAAAGAGVVIVSGKDVALHGAGDLVGKRYLLREMDGEAVAEDSAAFGSFVEWRSETSMSGKLCNVFHAGCSFENTVVKGEQLPAMTKMACADESMGKVEERFFAALRLGMSFLAIGESLELRRDDLVMRFAVEKDAKVEEPREAEEEAAAEENPEEVEEAAESEADASESEDEALVSVVVAVAVTEADLIDRKFILSKVDGEEFTVTTGSQPFIEFGEGMRVGGSACNVFTGLGALADGKLIVANAVATRKMCIDPKLSEFERDFHKMLREGVEAAMEGGALVLRDGERRVEFVEEK